MLSSRLQNSLSFFVGEPQTCGIKGQSILTIIHVARSMLQTYDSCSDQVQLFEIDLAKAFDRILHWFLCKTLMHVLLGHVLKNGIK